MTKYGNFGPHALWRHGPIVWTYWVQASKVIQSGLSVNWVCRSARHMHVSSLRCVLSTGVGRMLEGPTQPLHLEDISHPGLRLPSGHAPQPRHDHQLLSHQPLCWSLSLWSSFLSQDPCCSPAHVPWPAPCCPLPTHSGGGSPAIALGSPDITFSRQLPHPIRLSF